MTLGIEGNQTELSVPAKSVGRAVGIKTVVKLELWLTWGMNAGVLHGSLAPGMVGSQWGSPSPLKVTPGVLERSGRGARKGLMAARLSRNLQPLPSRAPPAGSSVALRCPADGRTAGGRTTIPGREQTPGVCRDW